MFQLYWRVGGVFTACLSASSFQISFAEGSLDSSIDVLSTVYSDFTPAHSTNPDYITSTVTVITPEQFKASDVTVADVIELSPSVQIQNSGELGSAQVVNVRGAPSQQTHIYIDGILQSNVGGSSGYLSQISLTDIERIEVYPGSVPLQFSQAAPGGAINIVRKQSNGTQANITLETGSFGQHRAAVSTDWRNQNWIAGAYVEAISSDNDFSYLNNNGTPSYNDDDSTQTRNNAEYGSLSGLLKGGYQTDSINLNIRFDAADSKKNIPHWNNFQIEDTYYQQTDWTLQTGISSNRWLPIIDSSLRWQTNEQKGHFSDPGNNVGTAANNSYDTLTSRQLLHHSSVFLPFGLLSINNELHNDGYRLNDDLTGTSLDAERQQLNNSGGLEWFVNDIVTASSVARHVWYEDIQDTNTQSEAQLGWQLGLRADLDKTTLQINVQQASRQPSFFERFGTRSSFQGNDDLVSELSNGIDASAQYTTNSLSLSTSVFYRTTTDNIAVIYDSQGIGQYINLDEATFYGVEWQAVLGIEDIQLLSSGSLQQTSVTSPLAAFNDKQVPGFYPISTRHSVEWQATSTITTSLDYVFESGLYYDRANSTLAPDKHEIGTNISWRWKDTRTSFAVNNLLDRQHTDINRKALPGISYAITFEYTIRKKES